MLVDATIQKVSNTSAIALHAIEVSEALRRLNSDSNKGLSTSEIPVRLRLYGANRIDEQKSKSLWQTLWDQLKNPLVMLLAIAAALSAVYGETFDAIAIVAVLLVNTAIGFVMERQAQRAMQALRKQGSLSTKALRDGKLRAVNADDLVPGDVVFIEAGDLVTADCRLLNVQQLQVNESALTGESVPVEKRSSVLPPQTLLAERTNTLFRGTFVTRGNGYALVFATGMQTEIGKIAGMVHSAEQSATPLEKKLQAFGMRLVKITAALAAVVFLAGLLYGNNVWSMLNTCIALAVAAVPEGLPVVATITLANGMLKLSRRNVVVKKLSSVETLGGTSMICTDKTGTLTQNKITVSHVVTHQGVYEASKPAPADDTALPFVLQTMVLCNTADIDTDAREGENEIGDPLEVGLLRYAVRVDKDALNQRTRFPKLSEEPFASETRMMATLHEVDGHLRVFAKGGVEQLLAKCKSQFAKNQNETLTEETRAWWIHQAESYAERGFRVIAAAYKDAANRKEDLYSDLIFVGLIGMMDPPRADVKGAVEECHQAGIDVVMVTGDHPSTALTIAKELGIAASGADVLAGAAMRNYDELTSDDKKQWQRTKVFARVSPANKLDLVRVLQEAGHVVGMTGDGVNDAPALKKADIGIAMGLRGTQVAQEVADMVLKDDAFSSIVAGIRHGRVIFENLRKFLIFMLSCNLNELLVIAVTAVLNFHFQLVPLQILFINLVTDVLPALALGVTAGSPLIMQHKPRPANEPLLDKKRWQSVLTYSLVIGASSIGAVLVSHELFHEQEGWNPQLCNNILFLTLIFSQLMHVFNMGSGAVGLWKSEVIRNRYVWLAVTACVAIVVGMYEVPLMRQALDLYRLSISDWSIVLGFSFIGFALNYMLKQLKWIRH